MRDAVQNHLTTRNLIIGVVAATLCLLSWSVAPLLIRSFREVVDAHTNNAVRYSFGALIWAPLLLTLIVRGKLDRSLFRRALPALFWNTIGQVCFALAFYDIDPGMVTFGLRSQIITVAIAAPILFPHERAILRSKAFLIGLAFVITGVLTMAAIATANADNPDIPAWRVARGIAYAAVAGVGYAGYGLSVRKDLDGVPHTHSFAVISLTTAVVMALIMVLLAPSRGLVLQDILLADYARLLLAGFIGIGISHVLFYLAMERLGVALATGVIQIQPVLVFSGSYLIYNEVFTRVQFGFGMLAVCGAILMVYAQHMIGQRNKRIAELAAAEGDVALYEAEHAHDRTSVPPGEGSGRA